MVSLLLMNFIDIITAVVLDWIIGDPRWFPHPVIFMGKLISFLEYKARKVCKTKKQIRVFGGVIVIILAVVSFLIPFIILLLLLKNSIILFNIVNIGLLCTTLSAKCLDQESRKVYFSLKKLDIIGARNKLSYIVGRDTANLGEDEVTRAVVETVAENTSDGVIAPLFYGIIFGAPLAMTYKAVNTMDSMLGYMNEKYRYIGFFPARVDDIFNFIPARITGVLISLSSPFVGGNILNSLKIMIRDRKNHKSPNCAYPEAAAAGAMGIQLGGTNMYFGEKVYKPNIGDKINILNFTHIDKCIKLMYFSQTIMVILTTVIFICYFKL
ncbi:adenosylcobinamide-phosphate synthase CbiB [Clostridium tyrobutyricum]|nr:adenosylcobinamide-phosphate synthase CbiB [Clostridium tyrobutyricum]